MNQRIVVVTGASAGIGRATALAFAKRGARVALLARNLDGLHAARAEVEAMGTQALVIPTDVSDYSQVEAAAARE
jgi:NADP-dependent 3-hydroxy acid dehydrogenase YdfG